MSPPILRALALSLLALSLPVRADSLPRPINPSARYTTECGSCHLAFHPALLNAGDWQLTLKQLDRHFGTDAAVDRPTALEISAFLERNAGTRRTEGAGNPPRITQTERFKRKHRDIPARFWRDPRVLSAAHCEACHREASLGRFSEHDLLIPELSASSWRKY